MSERLLNPYWGRLSAEKIAEGMNVARANAARLATDARTMLDAGRKETAAALAILSIEEAGKTSLLRELVLVTEERGAKQCWKRLRSHTAKNAMWIFPQLVSRGARHLDEFSGIFDPSSDHTDVLDKLKQVCIYCDCYGKAHWHAPAGTITDDLAQYLVKTAEIFAHGRDVTVREIELWIEHMGPVRRRSLGWQRKALANWYAQMQAEELAPAANPGMDEFIWGRKENTED